MGVVRCVPNAREEGRGERGACRPPALVSLLLKNSTRSRRDHNGTRNMLPSTLNPMEHAPYTYIM